MHCQTNKTNRDMLHTIFDNTKKIGDFAKSKEAQKILNDNHRGAEVQEFRVGDKVTTTETATYRQTGIIEEVYNNNGYWRYIVKGYNYKQSDLTKVRA